MFPSHLFLDRPGPFIADLSIEFNAPTPPEIGDLGTIVQTAIDSGSLTIGITSFNFLGM